MNVLFLAATLGLGGAEKQLVAWAEILQKDLGARVSVISFSPAQTARRQSLEDLDIPVAAVGRDRNVLGRIQSVVSFARKNRADVVHAFSCYLSPVAIAAAMATSTRPASSFRGDGLADLRALGTLYRRPTLRIMRHFTSNSREALDRVRPFVRAGTLLQYVPNLVTSPDPIVRAPRSDDGSRPIAVLAVGRLDANKRLDVFLEALAASRAAEPHLKGLIVGEGPERERLFCLAGDLGLLPDGVEFVGELADPTQSYRDADIFVHLAASEGTPNVALEAMAMGLPTVATPAGDLRRIIRPSQNGLLVPFDDAAATARCLIELARSPELRARLGEQGRLEVLRSHNAEQVRDSLHRFYSAMRL